MRVVSLEAHGSYFESKRLVRRSVINWVKIGQRQAVQFVGSDFEYSFAFGFSRLKQNVHTYDSRFGSFTRQKRWMLVRCLTRRCFPPPTRFAMNVLSLTLKPTVE